MISRNLSQQITGLILTVLFLLGCSILPFTQPTATQVPSTIMPTLIPVPPMVTPVLPTASPIPPTITPAPTSTPQVVELGTTVTDGKWEVTCLSTRRVESAMVLPDLKGGLLLPGTFVPKGNNSLLLVFCAIRNMTSSTATYTLADLRLTSIPQGGASVLGVDVANTAPSLQGLMVEDGWALLSEPMKSGVGLTIFYISVDGKASEHPISVAPGKKQERVFLTWLSGTLTDLTIQFQSCPPFRLGR